MKEFETNRWINKTIFIETTIFINSENDLPHLHFQVPLMGNATSRQVIRRKRSQN